MTPWNDEEGASNVLQSCVIYRAAYGGTPTHSNPMRSGAPDKSGLFRPGLPAAGVAMAFGGPRHLLSSKAIEKYAGFNQARVKNNVHSGGNKS
jgi:hypothetical protein